MPAHCVVRAEALLQHLQEAYCACLPSLPKEEDQVGEILLLDQDLESSPNQDQTLKKYFHQGVKLMNLIHNE